MSQAVSPSTAKAAPVVHDPQSPIGRVIDTLAQLAEDPSLPRNIRRGAQGACSELAKPHVAVDVRVASTVGILDDLANDSNLPVHGRTAIWSIISQLESLH